MFPESSSARGRVTRHHASAMNVLGWLLASAVCLVAMPSIACTGPDPVPLEERFRKATVVQIIRVMSVSVSPSGHPYLEGHAEVVETLKGDHSAEVPVRGYLPEVNCWVPLDVGRQYLVFLPDPSGRHEAWFAMFSRNIPVADVPESLLRKWRAKQ